MDKPLGARARTLLFLFSERVPGPDKKMEHTFLAGILLLDAWFLSWIWRQEQRRSFQAFLASIPV